MTGKFQGSTDLGGGVLTAQGSSDFYVTKFTAAGAALWSRSFGGSFPDASVGVAVDPAGDVLVLGYFSQAIDLGGGTLRTASSDYDVFLAKFASANGAYRWARSFAGPGYEMPYALSTDANGNVAITGYFQYTINLGGSLLSSVSSGTTDVFVAKYSPAGAHLWSERFGGTSSDYGTAMAARSTGHLVVTGMFNGVADFGGQSVTSAGSSDAFVLQLDP
jgi:hypothetical protein